jgi:hypothetical protein
LIMAQAALALAFERAREACRLADVKLTASMKGGQRER